MGDDDKDEQAASTLGERLLNGVRNLWKEVSSHGKVLAHHSMELEAVKKRVASLEREAQKLRISRGMAKAKSAKLKSALSESDKKLSEIRSMLN